jgi:hypothetical protein
MTKDKIRRVCKIAAIAVLLFVPAFLITGVITVLLMQVEFTVAPDVEVGMVLWGLYFLLNGKYFKNRLTVVGTVLLVVAAYFLVMKL